MKCSIDETKSIVVTFIFLQLLLFTEEEHLAT